MLESGYHEDMQKAASSKVAYQSEHASVLVLPNETWARRVSGVYGNELANQFPERAHACLLYTSPSPRDATLSRMPSSA